MVDGTTTDLGRTTTARRGLIKLRTPTMDVPLCNTFNRYNGVLSVHEAQYGCRNNRYYGPLSVVYVMYIYVMCTAAPLNHGRLRTDVTKHFCTLFLLYGHSNKLIYVYNNIICMILIHRMISPCRHVLR